MLERPVRAKKATKPEQPKRKKWRSFSHGAFRQDPKERGAVPKDRGSGLLTQGLAETGSGYGHYGWGSSGNSEPEKLRISYDGRERLKQLRKRQEVRNKAKESRVRRAFRNWLLKDQIKFTTKDGTVVRILKQAWLNVYSGKQRENRVVVPRALVLCFVDGKRLYFYKSSGENSGRAGEWFPTFGPQINPLFEGGQQVGKEAGWMTKLEGHPVGSYGMTGSRPPNFPPWVQEIQSKLKEAESKRKIQFQPAWDVNTFEILNSFFGPFGKIPRTDKINAKRD